MLGVIRSRRSTREGYDGVPISDEDLRAVVDCGLAGPSSKNAQPWRLHVVRTPSVIREIADDVSSSPDWESYVPHDPLTGRPRTDWESTVRESAAVLRQVGSAIFVENRGVFGRGRQVLEQATAERRAPSLVGYTLEVLGVGAVIENMWLAAVALGYQAAFMGDVLIAETAIKQRLSIEGDLCGVLVIGRSTDVPPVRRKPLHEDARPVSWF